MPRACGGGLVGRLADRSMWPRVAHVFYNYTSACRVPHSEFARWETCGLLQASVGAEVGPTLVFDEIVSAKHIG